MVDVTAVRESLNQSAQTTRIVMRCLSNGRDCEEYSQRALTLLTDILDLLYRVKDQISWAEEKWFVEASRLYALHEVLGCFGMTMKSIELYFQPGGVGVRYFRKHLLEDSYLPRLEQFKIMLLLSMQPESSERSSLDLEIRNDLRKLRSVEPSSLKWDLRFEEDVLGLTNRLSSEHFITLADLCNRRQQGTCKWIFKNSQYKQWLLGSFRTLLCVGPPGAGKTFLSSAIVDSLQRTFTSPDVATVFIFCQEEKEKEQTSMDLLQSILAQLVYRKRILSHTTAALYHSESVTNGRASAKAYQNAIRAEVNRFSKVFLVVDGLDAFSDKERILNRLQKLPEQAQLLVTLREPKHMDQAGYLGVLAPKDDLQLYTRARICAHEDLQSLLSPDNLSNTAFMEEVVRSVVERSHGLFLLAKLHLDFLSRYTDRSLLERALHHLPESLSEAYGEAMKQVVSQSSQANRLIYWTLYACRPLSVAELKCATAYDVDEKESTISFEQSLSIQTSGLLGVDAVTGTVRLVHRTASEYLNGTAARVFFPTAQKEMAEICLTVITPDEVVDDCYPRLGTASRNSSGGLISYAAAYWGIHAREVPEDEQTIQVLIKTFLNKLLWRRPAPQESVDEDHVPREQLGLAKYPASWSALHVLAYFGILGKSRRLLEQGANIDERDKILGWTPLHCASYTGNDEMVEFLLNQGANFNIRCEDGSTALHLATRQGHRKVMKLLLTVGIDTRVVDSQGATALQVAVGTASDEATVPLLVKNKVDVDVRNSRTGNTALHLAVEFRRPRILLFLLEKGAQMDVANEQGLTPLQVAAKTDNCEAISLLLQRGAAVEVQNLSGPTALRLAAKYGHWIAFDLLLIGGADVNGWNKEGETLLHEQAKYASDTAIAAKLLQQSANLEARTSQGFTPLQCAATSGNRAMFDYLLSCGAKVDVQTPKGESLLHTTSPANSDSLSILGTLLDHGLDVNAISSQGWTPLHQTVYCGTGIPDISLDKTAEYILLLLGRGADINACSLSAVAETPLHVAATALIARPSLVTFLIEQGANVNATTRDGRTPLHLAAERGREAIFRILLDAGADLTMEIGVASPTVVSGQGESQPNPSADVNGGGKGHGHTAVELARQNPFGALWFDEDGNLRPMPERSKRDSVATVIEDIDFDFCGTETEGSTLVGSEQRFVISSVVVDVK